MGYLGQGSEPTIAVQGDGSQIITYAPDHFPDPIRVYVGEPSSPGAPARNRTLFGEGRGGVDNVNWISPGGRWQFDMETQGRLVLSVLVDWTGSAISQTVFYRQEVRPAPSIPGGTPGPTRAGEVPGGSWFDSSTNIFGADIPNMGLLAGGGLLLLLVLRRRK